MRYFLALIMCQFFISFNGYGNLKDTTSIAITNYKKSAIVASGIVVGTQELAVIGKEIVQIELYAIYKGLRRTYLFVVSDTSGIHNMKLNQVYLVYADSDESDTFYSIRNLLIHDKIKNTELEEIKAYVRARFFRRIKKPMPQFVIETQGCGDCF
jgi:hypothetical protein